MNDATEEDDPLVADFVFEMTESLSKKIKENT
jgi:hypothetical protein